MRFTLDRCSQLLLLWIAFIIGTGSLAADPTPASKVEQPVLHHRSDQLARQVLFYETTLAENAPDVLARANRMPEQERFGLLSSWVFPADAVSGPRLDGSFSSPGGQLVAPALELIELGREVSRLDDLSRTVEQLDMSADDNRAQRSRSALRILIALARDDSQAARSEFVRLADLFDASRDPHYSQRWPETLVLSRAIVNPDTQKPAGELLYTMLNRHNGDTHGWQHSGSSSFDRHFHALFGRWLHLDAGRSADRFPAPPELANWFPVTQRTARSIGDGFPIGHWHAIPGHVDQLAGDEHDSLFFRSPLTGDFEVECELTPHHAQDMRIMVAGLWVHPTASRRQIEVGSLGVVAPQRIAQSEQLAPFDLFMPVRAVMRGGVCSWWINGRKVFERSVPEPADPWVAILSQTGCHGSVRNLRITGSPVIPDEVRLATHPDLPGWIRWFEEMPGPKTGWRFDGSSGTAELIGPFNRELAGTSCESLISYQRPFAEEGTVSYEFFHEPNRSLVHPAIGSLALLLESDGVAMHRVTSGPFDRSGTDPLNRVVEPQCRRGDGPLPLRPGDWNRIELTVRGDVLELALNGQPVFERPLDATESRHFGLFHYSDQTQARVRNIVWRGDWPKQLPAVPQQELALPDHECLHGLERLVEASTVRFDQTLPSDWSINEGNADVGLAAESAGLFVQLGQSDKWTSAKLSGSQPIYGDFDAQLRLSHLRLVAGTKGIPGVELAAVDDAGNLVATVRSLWQSERQQAVSKLMMPLPDGTRRQSSSILRDEMSDGTLRLVRRGDEIHSLIAHGDSPNFRHIGSQTLTPAGVPVRIQIQALAMGMGSTTVTFESVTVRSNSKAVLERLDPNVLAIDQYAMRWRGPLHRFAQDGLKTFEVSPGLHTTIDERGLTISADHSGTALRAVSPEAPGRSSSVGHVRYALPITGDFDIAASVGLSGLAVSEMDSSPVRLSLQMPGSAGTTGRRAELIVRRVSMDKLHLEARSGDDRDGSGSFVGQADAGSIESLRLVRIQKTLLFVYSTDGTERLLGQADCSDTEVPAGGLSLGTNFTGLPADNCEVRWKSLQVRTAPE